MKNQAKVLEKRNKMKGAPMERWLLKFSEAKVKKLTIDYEDQTLGGMRKFDETILSDGIKRTYTYAVEFTKFIRKHPAASASEALQPASGGPPHGSGGPDTIPSLYKKCPINAIMEGAEGNKGSFKRKHKAEAVKRETRGRPRKYPVGEEPYKRKKNIRALTQPSSPNGESEADIPLPSLSNSKTEAPQEGISVADSCACLDKNKA